MTKFVFAPKSVQVTATTTSQAVGVPVEDGLLNCAREVLVSASAEVYVKLATSGSVAATTNDILIQPGDSLRLQTSNCAFISVITASGTSRVSISGVSNGIGASCNTLDLTFLRDTLDPRITFTRASSGTHFDSTGRLVVDGNDVARFDYDPATLLPRGLLIEEARTNLILHSRDMTQAAWSKSGAIATKDQLGIDGVSNSCSKIIESAANVTHWVAQNAGAASVGAGATYTGSAVIKAAGRTKAEVWLHDGAGSNGGYCFIDLTTGAVSSVTNTGGTNTSASSDNLGGGWWRVKISTTNGASPINAQIRAYPNDGIAGHDTAYSGNGTSGIIIDCAQLEVGAFATSVIHTGAATATRAADNASMTGTNFSSWWNQLGGTMVCEESGVGRAYAISSGTTNEMVIQISQQPESMIGRSAAVQTFSISTQGTLGAVNKTAAYISASNTRMSTNGSVVQTTAGALRPDLFNTLSIGSQLSAPTSEHNGWIRSIRFYNTQPPDATLRALST